MNAADRELMKQILATLERIAETQDRILAATRHNRPRAGGPVEVGKRVKARRDVFRQSEMLGPFAIADVERFFIAELGDVTSDKQKRTRILKLPFVEPAPKGQRGVMIRRGEVEKRGIPKQ